MLAVVERARLGGALLLLGAAATLFTIEMVERRTAGPTHGYGCADARYYDDPAGPVMVRSMSLVQAGAAADNFYRHQQFESAECILRVTADRQKPSTAEALHVVASFYHQLGHSWDIAFDRTDPDSLDHLEWAIQFDTMLGGAFHDRLVTERDLRYRINVRK